MYTLSGTFTVTPGKYYGLDTSLIQPWVLYMYDNLHVKIFEFNRQIISYLNKISGKQKFNLQVQDLKNSDFLNSC